MRSPTIRSECRHHAIKGGPTCHARTPCLPERWSLWSSGSRSPPVAATQRPVHPPAKARRRPRSIRIRACFSSPPAIRADHAVHATRARRYADLVDHAVRANRAIPARLRVDRAGRVILATPVTLLVVLADRVIHVIRATPVQPNATPVGPATPVRAPAGRAAPATRARRALRSVLTAWCRASLPLAAPADHVLLAVRAIPARVLVALADRALPVIRAIPVLQPATLVVPAARASRAIHAPLPAHRATRAAPAIHATPARPAKRSS